MSDDTVLAVKGLRQEFTNRRQGEYFQVDVPGELRLPQGAFVAIQGPNGCGKTTLVTVLALLRCPSNVRDLEYFYLNVPAPNGGMRQVNLKELWSCWWKRHQINVLRRQFLGFAPQQLELLPALRVDETVASSLWLNGESRRTRRQRLAQLLDQFSLTKAKVTSNRINAISGGQQQKVTLARAIAHRPLLVFLDEPTAYLYHADAREALTVLRRLQRDSVATAGVPTTVVMITHDNDLARDFATHVITMNVVEYGDRRIGCVDAVREQVPAIPAPDDAVVAP